MYLRSCLAFSRIVCSNSSFVFPSSDRIVSFFSVRPFT